MKIIINKITNCETINWNELKTYEFNTLKEQKDRDVSKLKNSIINSGFNTPFYIWANHQYVIDGTGRQLALLELEKEGVVIPDLPIVKIQAESKKEALKIVMQVSSQHGQISQSSLADFTSADFELDELKQLAMEELNLEQLNIMVSDIKIEELPDIEEDNIPELQKTTKVVEGDIFEFQIKDNFYRFGCGDSTNIDFITKLLQEKEADLIHTDPPYNVAVQNSKGMKIQNDNMSQKDFKDFMAGVYSVCNIAIKKGGVAYIYHGESERVTFTEEFVKAGFKFAQNLIWVKSSSTFTRQDYNWRHEPILYGWKENAGHYFSQDFTQTTVIDDDNIDLRKLSKPELINIIQNQNQKKHETIIYEDKTLLNDIHPTMKPVKLCAKLILNSSRINELVLDLFLGSGSTAIACIQTQRNCVGSELDPIYIDASIRRIFNFLEKNSIDYKFKHKNGNLTLEDFK